MQTAQWLVLHKIAQAYRSRLFASKLVGDDADDPVLVTDLELIGNSMKAPCRRAFEDIAIDFCRATNASLPAPGAPHSLVLAAYSAVAWLRNKPDDVPAASACAVIAAYCDEFGRLPERAGEFLIAYGNGWRGAEVQQQKILAMCLLGQFPDLPAIDSSAIRSTTNEFSAACAKAAIDYCRLKLKHLFDLGPWSRDYWERWARFISPVVFPAWTPISPNTNKAYVLSEFVARRLAGRFGGVVLLSEFQPSFFGRAFKKRYCIDKVWVANRICQEGHPSWYAVERCPKDHFPYGEDPLVVPQELFIAVGKSFELRHCWICDNPRCRHATAVPNMPSCPKCVRPWQREGHDWKCASNDCKHHFFVTKVCSKCAVGTHRQRVIPVYFFVGPELKFDSLSANLHEQAAQNADVSGALEMQEIMSTFEKRSLDRLLEKFKDGKRLTRSDEALIRRLRQDPGLTGHF